MLDKLKYKNNPFTVIYIVMPNEVIDSASSHYCHDYNTNDKPGALK